MHRDLKPRNFMLRADQDPRSSDGWPYTLVLIDYKFATTSAKSTESIWSLNNGCSDEWMAPEVARLVEREYLSKFVTQHPEVLTRHPTLRWVEAPVEGYDERVDIWSIGVIMYYLTIGRVPFASLSRDDNKWKSAFNGYKEKYWLHRLDENRVNKSVSTFKTVGQYRFPIGFEALKQILNFEAGNPRYSFASSLLECSRVEGEFSFDESFSENPTVDSCTQHLRQHFKISSHQVVCERMLTMKNLLCHLMRRDPDKRNLTGAEHDWVNKKMTCSDRDELKSGVRLIITRV